MDLHGRYFYRDQKTNLLTTRGRDTIACLISLESEEEGGSIRRGDRLSFFFFFSFTSFKAFLPFKPFCSQETGQKEIKKTKRYKQTCLWRLHCELDSLLKGQNHLMILFFPIAWRLYQFENVVMSIMRTIFIIPLVCPIETTP